MPNKVPDGLLFLDKDGAVSLREKYERETGRKFPETLLVRSSVVDDAHGGTIAKGHWYFKHTPRTLALTANIPESKTGGLFSLRLHNQYVASIGSLHPDTKQPYIIAEAYPVLQMPDELLEWLLKQVVEEPTASVKPAERRLWRHGEIHPALISHVGGLLNKGVHGQPLIDAAIQWAHESCEAPIDEPKIVKETKDCESRYGVGKDENLLLTQGQPVAAQADKLELDTTGLAARPVFPLWTLFGTSVYDGLIQPAIKESSKHAEFIALPAIQLMLNYLSGKVEIGTLHHTNLNLFVGLISPYGKFFKSSSCQLAHDYFRCVGISRVYGPDVKTAEGQIIIMQAGSSEGFGLKMQGCNAKNGLLFNDELGKLVAKAGIENSSFASDILSWYESGQFGNNTKNHKTNFNFENGTYTFGWLWCTTDRGFNRHWPKLAGISSGLEDRMFFVVCPETPKATVPLQTPNFFSGAIETKRRIDKAIQQKQFQFEDFKAFSAKVSDLDPRSMALVEKLALYLAVDLGLSEIDIDCVERAVALVGYRNQATRFLSPIEAENQQGRLQKEMIRELQQRNGKMPRREFCRNLDYTRYGLDVWNRAYGTMLQAKILVEFDEETTPGKRATKMVGLVKLDD